MVKTKIHHVDHIIYAFVFILIAVAGFMYFSSAAMIDTRAAQNPNEAILTCYKDRKPEMCPETPPQPGADKNLRICNICYSKCMICVAARRFSDKNCTATCVQEEETPTATSIPLQ